MSCEINGKRCTQCCRTIMLRKHPAIDKIFQGKDDAVRHGGDIEFVARNWIPITPEQAEIENPFMFQSDEFVASVDAGELTFYRCNHVTDAGCGCYETRPQVCRGYPDYPEIKPYAAPIRIALSKPDGEYANGCVPWVEMVSKIRSMVSTYSRVRRCINSPVLIEATA